MNIEKHLEHRLAQRLAEAKKKRITIKKTPNADTRTCDPSTVSKAELLRCSKLHISDVKAATDLLCDLLKERSVEHDFDKVDDIDGFYKDFQSDDDFVSGDWYQNHIRVNRHHPTSEGGEAKDLNMIDILEMILDCTVSAMARAGEVPAIEIPSELLQLAVENQVKQLSSMINVED